MILPAGDGLYRGSRPETLADWAKLQQLGVKTILNLEMGYFDLLHGQVNEEVREAAARGMASVHLQLGDIFPPSEEDLYSVVMIAKQAMARGALYVHCLHGVDRTGLAVAMIHRWAMGWSAEGAIGDMYSQGFHRFPYELLGWTLRLRSCLQNPS